MLSRHPERSFRIFGRIVPRDLLKVFHRREIWCLSDMHEDTRMEKNMKKLGIAAAILLVALLVTGVVSALDTAQTTDGQPIKVRTMHVDNVTQFGDHWMIQGSELEPWTTSDGQIIKKITIKVDNETQIGDPFAVAGRDPGPDPVPSPDRIKIGVVHSPTSRGGSGSVAPGYADLWGPFSWNAGDPVRVSATWTPTSQGVYLGIYDRANPSWAYTEWKTGGSGTYSTFVPYTSSQWTFAIRNPTSNSATVNYVLT